MPSVRIPVDAPAGPAVLALLLFWAGSAAIASGPGSIFSDDFESAECSNWSRSSNPQAAPDADADTYGDENQATTYCQLPSGLVPDATDCDDSSNEIHPGAIELCDGIDQDCDGIPDNNVNGNTNPSCASFVNLGSISGDTGAGTVGAVGWTEAWYRVRLTEDSATTKNLNVRVDLQVPSGADFDLYVYCLSCGGSLVGQSTSAGAGLERVEARSVDGVVPHDDGFDILIEIRYFNSSVCAPWTLDVFGSVGSSTNSCSPP